MTRPIAALLVIAGSISAISGGEASRAAAPLDRQLRAEGEPPAGSGLIFGHVVSAATGEPITGAVVTLSLKAASGAGADRRGAFQARVLVDSQARFLFYDLPPGDVSLMAEADGYMPGGAGTRGPAEPTVPLQLADGQRVPDVTIRLWKFAAIGGSVFDEFGEALPGVSVHLMRRTAGAQRLTPQGTSKTDDRGAFRFWSLEPGRYVVAVPSTTTSLPASAATDYVSQLNERVSPLVRGPVTSAPEPAEPGFRVGDSLLQPLSPLARAAPPPAAGRVLVYRTTFYPGGTTASQAQDIVLGAGDDRSGVDLTATLVGTSSVSGNVTGPDGPMPRLKLDLVPADTADWADSAGFETASTLTDERGAFTFLGVPPGQYAITGTTSPAAAAPRRGASTSIADLNLPVRWVRSTIVVGDAPVVGLALVSHAPIRVSGRLRFTGASAPPTADQMREIAVSLASLTRQNVDATPVSSIAADGRVGIDGCLPGSYAVEVSAPGAPWTLASITAEGRDLIRMPLVLDTDVTDLVIAFTDRPAEVAGVVQAANQDETFTVFVFPAEYQAAAAAGLLSRSSRGVAVDASRQFSIRGLPPGDYLVAAVSSEDAGRWTDPDGLRAIASQATALTVAEGASRTIALRPVVIR